MLSFDRHDKININQQYNCFNSIVNKLFIIMKKRSKITEKVEYYIINFINKIHNSNQGDQ